MGKSIGQTVAGEQWHGNQTHNVAAVCGPFFPSTTDFLVANCLLSRRRSADKEVRPFPTHRRFDMRTSARLFGVAILVVGFVLPTAQAVADVDPHEQLKQHLRDVVHKVKAAATPAEKRSILDEELRDMLTALDRVEAMSNLSSRDQAGIEALRTRLQEKLDELHGQNGYDAVPDSQLDAFADYVQQDFEQADTLTITITSTALLVLLLIILLV